MDEIISALPKPMQPNETLLVVAVIFLVLILVLNNLIFKPLLRILDERQKKIEEGESAARQAQNTVTESLALYAAEKTKARQKAQAERQKMLTEVEATRSDMLESAKAEAKAQLDKARTQIESQVATARTSLQAETRGFADQIAAKILSRPSA